MAARDEDEIRPWTRAEALGRLVARLGNPEWHLACSEQDRQAIVNTLPASLRQSPARLDAFMRSVENRIAVACLVEQTEERMPKSADARGELEKLLKATDRLIRQLNSLDLVDPLIWSDPDGYYIGDYDGGHWPPETRIDLEGLARQLVQLHQVVKVTLQKGPSRPQSGRFVPPHQQGFMQALADLWEEYTGDRPGYRYTPSTNTYHGSFLDFAEAASKLVGWITRRDFVEYLKRRRKAEKSDKTT